MTLLCMQQRYTGILVIIVWLQGFTSGYCQVKKVAPQPLPEGLRTVLVSRDDKDHEIYCIAITSDGERVAVAHHGEIGIWTIRTGKKHPFTFSIKITNTMLFTDDGNTLLTVDEQQGVLSWDVNDGQRLRNFIPGLKEGVFYPKNCLAYSPSDGMIACSVKGSVCFWELIEDKELTNKRITPPKNHSFTALGFSFDGSRLFGGTYSATAGFRDEPRGADLYGWVTHSQRPILTLTRRWDKYPDRSVSYCHLSSDARLLVCCSVRHLPRRGVGEADLRGQELRISDTESRAYTRVWDLACGEILFEGEGAFSGSTALSLDGRLLAILEAGKDGKFKEGKFALWDLYSQQTVARFAYPDSYPGAVAFVPGGETFVTTQRGSRSSCLSVWEMPKKLPVALPFLPRSRYWEDLGNADARKARQAIWKLMATPKQTVAFLREHLKPIAALDRDKVENLVADLNSERFTARDQAMKQLEELSWYSAPQLEAALGNPASQAQKKLIEDLLKRLDPPYTSTDRLRRLRAIEVLERIGTPDAVKLLEVIGKGAAKAPETEDANASLKRLARKAKSAP